MKRKRPSTPMQCRAKAAQLRSRAAGLRPGLLRSFYLRIAQDWEDLARKREREAACARP
jgi:hypothetical protein